MRRIKSGIFHYIQTGRPYVTMKYAMTMDGKIAAYTGASRWVTGEEARHHVHEQRKKILGSWWGSVRYWQMILCLTAA